MSKPTTPASGTGTLTTGHGTNKVTTTVTTPITLTLANSRLVDNEANAVITGADLRFSVTEIGAGATITLGNGNDSVSVSGGTAAVTLGNGNDEISLVGNTNTLVAGNGRDEVTVNGTGNSVTLGNGNNEVALSSTGTGNSVTLGNGNNEVTIGAGNDGGCEHHASATPTTVPVTTDTLTLGSGNNHVFLRSSGNTVNEGTGVTTIDASSGINNRFVLAAGGTSTITGFTLTNGDTLDLTKVLADVSLAHDLSNLSSYVSLTSVVDAKHSAWTDTVLTITNGTASSTVTLLNTGTITLANLQTASLVLPTH